MRQVAGSLRLDMAQFRSLAAFAQFASDLDPATKRQIDRGLRLTEVLKQPQYQPLAVETQVAIIWAATNGLADHVPVERVSEWEEGWVNYLNNAVPAVLTDIREKRSLDDDLTARLRAAAEEYNKTVSFE
jgi:F-type H+-transporting ATPase subunit alpha